MPSAKPIDVDRWIRQDKLFKNYLGNRWLYMKETYDVPTLLEYLDDCEEIDETFPTWQVIHKGRNLFIDQ